MEFLISIVIEFLSNCAAMFCACFGHVDFFKAFERQAKNQHTLTAVTQKIWLVINN